MRVLDHLFQTAGLNDAAAEDIRRRMGAPGRFYHGLGHLTLLWSRHRKFSAGTEFGSSLAGRSIACAIAFHDAVYDPRRNDNEACSAKLWREQAPPDLDHGQVEWVAATIAATADHLAARDAGSPSERLRLWMLDLDLTPLGEKPTVFAHNTRSLRKEFAHLSDVEWERRRIGFLRSVQAAPRIYRCNALAAAFEAQARSNIGHELAASNGAQ